MSRYMYTYTHKLIISFYTLFYHVTNIQNTKCLSASQTHTPNRSSTTPPITTPLSSHPRFLFPFTAPMQASQTSQPSPLLMLIWKIMTISWITHTHTQMATLKLHIAMFLLMREIDTYPTSLMPPSTIAILPETDPISQPAYRGSRLPRWSKKKWIVRMLGGFPFSANVFKIKF